MILKLKVIYDCFKDYSGFPFNCFIWKITISTSEIIAKILLVKLLCWSRYPSKHPFSSYNNHHESRKGCISVK